MRNEGLSSSEKEIRGLVQRFGLAGTVLIMGVLSGTVGLACGDKLLLVGRGIRFQHAYSSHPANVLIFANTTPNGAALRNPKLQETLKKAGHKLQTVEAAPQLDAALKSGKVDVVLADFQDMAAIARELQASASKPTALPVLFKASKADLIAAQKYYQFALKAPADDIHVLAAINEVMKVRSRAGSKT